MKSKLILTVIVIFCTSRLLSQAPTYSWAKSAGGSGTDYIKNIVTDSNGNIYLTGYFYGDSIKFGNITLTSPYNVIDNDGDLYIAKYDPLGNVIWVKSAIGPGEDKSSGISIDSSNNLYISGKFQDSLFFGNNITLIAPGINLFVAKYDTSGNIIWIKNAPAHLYSGSFVNSIACDKSGHFYITGIFTDTISFGNTVLISPTWDPTIFIAKYDSSGNALWAKCGIGANSNSSNEVATDNFGNVYITGFFQSSSLVFDSITIYNGNYENIFLAKYDSLGNIIWAKSIGNYAYQQNGQSVTTDLNGNVYVTGIFLGPTITFGNIILHNASGSSYIESLFIVKYNSSGNVLWAKAANSSTANLYGNRVRIDNNGNVLVTGGFEHNMVFGNDTFTDIFPPYNDDNFFLLKLDLSGNLIWGKSGYGISGSSGQGIALDQSNNIYISGLYANGDLILGSDTLHNIGSADIFLAKLTNTVSGINIFENELSIIVFPNPTNCQFSIKIPRNSKFVTITNSLGQTIEKRPIKNQKEISFYLKNNGIYFAKIITANGIITKKVIVCK